MCSATMVVSSMLTEVGDVVKRRGTSSEPFIEWEIKTPFNRGQKMRKWFKLSPDDDDDKNHLTTDT